MDPIKIEWSEAVLVGWLEEMESIVQKNNLRV